MAAPIPYVEIAAAVVTRMLAEHPAVAARVVEAVVVDAAGELAGAVGPDFPRLLVIRSSARLAAMAGSPIALSRAERVGPATRRRTSGW
jgi:hypothetical protein